MIDAENIAPGTQLDRYVIESQLGSGGMGTVYRARHAHMGNPVALKVLHRGVASDPSSLERFLREAKASAMSGSPNIVRVLDFGIVEGTAFLVMELLEGRELWAMLRETGPLPPARAVAITLEILSGVAAAHAAGIVHRDLKPQNVFLARQADGTEVAKLLDFGISKILEGASVEHLTRTGVLVGTPAYMAPEQFTGSRAVDHRADLYSVAVLLYELLSRHLPHDADGLSQLIISVTTRSPRALSEVAASVPPALVQLVHKGLERDPMARFQSAAEFSGALRALSLDASAPAAAPSAGVGGPVGWSAGAGPTPPASAMATAPTYMATPAPSAAGQATPPTPAPAAAPGPPRTPGLPPTLQMTPPPAVGAPVATMAMAPGTGLQPTGGPPGAGLQPTALQPAARSDNTLRNVLLIVGALFALLVVGTCGGCWVLGALSNAATESSME